MIWLPGGRVSIALPARHGQNSGLALLLRAGSVRRADDWAFSGMQARHGRDKPFSLADWPMGRLPNWAAVVNDHSPEEEFESLCICVNRG